MELSQPEIIQILRRRAGMNQGAFGAKAFNTSYESGRTKVKNLELGKQEPTAGDIEKMASVLKVSPEMLASRAGNDEKTTSSGRASEIFIPKKVLDRFQGLDSYIDILDKAIALEDEELIDHICGKIADLFTCRPAVAAVNQ